MLYYIYIGNSQTAIDHLSKVTNGMFVTVSGARKAAKIIDGIRERYNTSILYEQTDTEKDCRQKPAKPICRQASIIHCRHKPMKRASTE